MEPPLKVARSVFFLSDQSITYSSYKGEWKGSALTLQASDSCEFTINFP